MHNASIYFNEMEQFHRAQTKKKSFFLPSFAYFSSVIQFIVALCRHIHCCMVTMMQENGTSHIKPTHTHKKYGLGSFTVNDNIYYFQVPPKLCPCLGFFRHQMENHSTNDVHMFFPFQPFWMTVSQKNMIQKQRDDSFANSMMI